MFWRRKKKDEDILPIDEDTRDCMFGRRKDGRCRKRPTKAWKQKQPDVWRHQGGGCGLTEEFGDLPCDDDYWNPRRNSHLYFHSSMQAHFEMPETIGSMAAARELAKCPGIQRVSPTGRPMGRRGRRKRW